MLKMFKKSLFLFFLLLLQSYGQQFKERLDSALKIAQDTLTSIYDKWDISNYPNFLKSVSMTHTSWEVMKLKFQQKILRAANGEQDVKFIMTFMGSSVTAGHDSPFNISFSQTIGPRLSPAFNALGVKSISFGAALGNNPCLPYDICVHPFAGADADVVHWEQSFNCFGDSEDKRPVFEWFVRQALSLPNQAISIFEDSSMPNWKEEDCPKDDNPIPLSDEDKQMLEHYKSGNAIKIPTEMNKADMEKGWRAMIDLFRNYKTAGIQTWHHYHYDKYKCKGPYKRDWACCSASWHPSLKGHDLRSDHHVFYWLLILIDAIKDLQEKGERGETSDVLLKVITKHIEAEHKYVPASAMYESDYQDSQRCYTSFQPRRDDTYALEKLMITSGDGKEGFKMEIIDTLNNRDFMKRVNQYGYIDLKYMLYGNKDSGVLSLKINVKQHGVGFLCQPAGDWGRLPDGFQNFWEVDTKVYLTENVGPNPQNFIFSKDKGRLLEYINRKPKDTQTICVDFIHKIPPGDHVMTIVPTTEKKIMISYLIIP